MKKADLLNALMVLRDILKIKKLEYTIAEQMINDLANIQLFQWKRISEVELEDGRYYQATLYGIHIYPDVVVYNKGEEPQDDYWYSTKQKRQISAKHIAFIGDLPSHPTGNKEVIDFQRIK